MRLTNLLIKNTNEKGRGVFTNMEIKNDEIIEICPIIKINTTHQNKIDDTELYNYYFLWDDNNFAIALGFGSLYNHSNQPNATYFYQKENDTIIFKALKNIKPDKEILVDYTNGSNKVWFLKNNKN